MVRSDTTILVVEDEPLVGAAIAEELRAEGFVVIEASRGDEALAALRRDPQIHLVVTDLHMPGAIDGKELVRAIRTNFPSTKLLVLSAFAADRELAALADACFLKPVATGLIASMASLLLGR